MFLPQPSVQPEPVSYSPISRTTALPLTLIDPALAAKLPPTDSAIGQQKVLPKVVPAWKGREFPALAEKEIFSKKNRHANVETCEEEIGKSFKDGRSAFRFGGYSEALNLYQSAYSLIRKDHRAIVAYHLGVCHQRLSQFDQAISFYFEYLAFEAANMRDRVLTLEQIRLARAKDPIALTYLPLLSEEAAVQVEEDASACFKTAQMLFQLQDHGAALEKFTEAYEMEQVPATIREAIVYNMAVCNQTMGRFNTAMSFYQEYAMYTTDSTAKTEALQQIAECRKLNRSDRLASTSPKCHPFRPAKAVSGSNGTCQTRCFSASFE